MSTTIEAFGSTSLIEDGGFYFLQPNGGAAVELSYGGSPVAVGQFGQWAPIAAEQTANGYQVVWKQTGVDQYLAWNVDSSGNCVSSALDPTSGASAALKAMEVGFQQDLNGDGTIGNGSGSTGTPPSAGGSTGTSATVIEAFGSTSLVENGNHFFLQPNGGTAVELSYTGSPVVDGQFGQWAPIAAEQTGTGYQVVWKQAGADQYLAWNVDSSGNCVSSALDPTSGASAALKAMEVSFQQDLNGDGSIGTGSGSTGTPPPGGGLTGTSTTVIEAFGSTSLVGDGSHYFLQPNGGSSVELSYGGSPVVVGQFGQWAPIAAEQTGTGYQVVWKQAGADQYLAWNVDSSGNCVSSALDPTSGASAALKAMEVSFQQDLNGDGTIGNTSGSTGTSSAPHFVYQGVDSDGAQIYNVTWDTPGEEPIAVRVLTPGHPSTSYSHTFLYALPVEAGIDQLTFGSGLDELQKLGVQNQYNATIIEPIFPTASWYANSSTDPTMNYETFMATYLPAWVDSNFSTTGGTEENLLVGFSKSGYGALDLLLKHPSVFADAAAWDFPSELTFNDFGAGDNYGTVANFQANYQLSASFIDTWKAPFTTQDRIWISEGSLYAAQVADFDALLSSQGVLHTTTQDIDNHSWSGGWLSDAVAGLYGLVDGSTSTPPPGGGSTGTPPPASGTVIEAFGSTSLVEDGSHYFLQPNGGVAVELSYGGSPVVDGQFSQWAPIAAEQVSSGYQVVWKQAGADQYLAWNVDSSGNCVSGALDPTSGASTALKAMEVTFQQDLNGDGSIGSGGGSTGTPPPGDGSTGTTSATVIEAFGSTSLLENASHYFLQPNGGSAVELSYDGSPVVDGQFGQWAPIAAEQMANGYQVVWAQTGAGQYLAWNVDNSGNCVSGALDPTSGTSAALQSMEITFNQDLNGDGYKGLVLKESSGGQTLTAGSSSTTLIGGPSDILNGGAGADTFVFKADFGANTVNNFTPGVDVLQFSQSAIASASAALGDAHQVGSDIVIALDAHDVVTLHNVQLANLHTSDFQIV